MYLTIVIKLLTSVVIVMNSVVILLKSVVLKCSLNKFSKVIFTQFFSHNEEHELMF